MPHPKSLKPKHCHHAVSGRQPAPKPQDDGKPVADRTVSMVVLAFWEHAKTYYRPRDGSKAGNSTTSAVRSSPFTGSTATPLLRTSARAHSKR
jgi:hypothetical protein